MEWSGYNHFDFVVYNHPVYSSIPEFRKSGPNVVLIFLSDEEGLIPAELSGKFYAVLKTYWPLKERMGNILSFPIGYSNSARLSRFVPFGERRYSASYAGNFFPNRWDFYRQFSILRFFPPFPISSTLVRKLFWHVYKRSGLFRAGEKTNWIPSSRVYFSDGFARGLSREEYGEIISQTKIALCPRGFISTECFRIFETMRLGCVLVADELPPTVWFKNSPIVIEKDWLNIRPVIERLLADPDRLLALHRETLAWWENVCSERSSARYLAGELDAVSRGS